VKYLPLFHHFKAIYQFPKHIIFWVIIVANAPLKKCKSQPKKNLDISKCASHWKIMLNNLSKNSPPRIGII
jgi:hypothetical protein